MHDKAAPGMRNTGREAKRKRKGNAIEKLLGIDS